jgi:hypothetical protein
MTTDLASKAAFDFGYVWNVIEVAMRQEQKLGIDFPGGQPIASSIGCVEKNPALRRFKQVAIRLENAATKALVDHRISL